MQKYLYLYEDVGEVDYESTRLFVSFLEAMAYASDKAASHLYFTQHAPTESCPNEIFVLKRHGTATRVGHIVRLKAE